MKDFSPIKAATALFLVILGASPACSQSTRGALGAQSRASIRIEASVMPTFRLSSAASGASLSSNAPSIRYSLLVDDDRVPRAVGTRGSLSRGTGPLLLLVVPD